MKKIFCFFLLVFLVLMGAYYFQPAKTGKGIDPGLKYELVKGWPAITTDIDPGDPSGIAIDTSQDVFVFHRANREWPLLGSMPDKYISSKTILLLDRQTGKLKHSWGDNLFIMPHGLTVDHNNQVWVTDLGLHQVFKFSHDGKLLMTLGEEKIPGNDSVHFNRPTDVAVAEDGCFYVSDGYKNNRIVKFSADGKYLFEWGSKGKEPGEFNIPHGICLDKNGNLYVADRENNRVQIFDSTGRFLKQLTDESFGNICSVAFGNEKLMAVDDHSFLKIKHRGSDVFIFDSSGSIASRFGRSGNYEGSPGWFHDIAVDKDGNIYVGDILGNKILKFKKTKNR